MVQTTLAEGFGGGSAVLLQYVLFQGSAVDSDAYGDVASLTGIHNRLDTILPADIPGIDADLIHAVLGALQGYLVVKMNIRYDGGGDSLLLDGQYGFGSLRIGHRNADDITACRGQRFDLTYRCLNIVGVGIGHGLNGDGVVGTDGNLADFDLGGTAANGIVIH